MLSIQKPQIVAPSSFSRPADIQTDIISTERTSSEDPQSLLSASLVPLPYTPAPSTDCVLDNTVEREHSSSTPSISAALSVSAPRSQSEINTTIAESIPAHSLPSSSALSLENLKLLRNPLSPKLPVKATKSFAQHRKLNRSEEIPRQAILKALAARNPTPTSPISIARNLQPMSELNASPRSGDLKLDTVTGLPSASLMDTPRPNPNQNTLKSPCFYHQRFDQVVDFEKVLDEIAIDQDMSHSRLLQTATGVREVSRQLQRRPIKAAVRNVMIVTKARDNSLVSLTREVAEWLIRTPRYGSKYGVTVYVDKKLKHSKRFNAPGLINDEPEVENMLKYWTPDLCWTSPDKFDLVLTLGGDGTVLFTSWLFQRIVPPILSFSLGSLGFLTNFKFDLYKEHLDKIMTDGMRVNLRMRFTCTVFRDQPSGEPIEAEKFEVLNELVIDRGPSPYVSSMELYGDDNLITVIQADGCIFSTPTGSTAYSLSAGGSLVHPDIPATLITPICPHTLSFRPMILSDSMALRINIPKGSRATAHCAFDGRARLELKQGDYVTIAASQYPFPTVLSQPQEWIDSIVRTLKWNTRAAAQKAFTKDDDEHDIDGESSGWDIDTTDSGCYSDDGDEHSAASPLRRQMSLMMNPLSY